MTGEDLCMKEKHNYPYHVTRFCVKGMQARIEIFCRKRRFAISLRSFFFSSLSNKVKKSFVACTNWQINKFAKIKAWKNKRRYCGRKFICLRDKNMYNKRKNIKYRQCFLSIWLFCWKTESVSFIFVCRSFFMEINSAVVSHLLTLTSCCRCRYAVVCVMVSFHD